jgi:hypothetical protein
VQRGGGGVEFFFRIKKAAGKGLQIAGRRNPRWGGGDWEGGAPTRFAIRNRQAGRAAGAGGREGRLGAGLSLGGGARVWGICPDLGGDGSERRGRWRGSSACCVALMLSPPSPMNGLLLRRLLRLLLACSAQRCCCCCWPAAAVGGCVRACVGGRKRGERTMLCYAWEEETRQQHESLLPLAAGSGGLTDLLLRLPLLTERERERDRETQPVDYLQN